VGDQSVRGREREVLEVLRVLEATAKEEIVAREDIVRVTIMVRLHIELEAFLVLLDNGLANPWRGV
jgi:hypothetical protein